MEVFSFGEKNQVTGLELETTWEGKSKKAHGGWSIRAERRRKEVECCVQV